MSCSGLVESADNFSVLHEVLGVDLAPIFLLLGQLHSVHFLLELGDLFGGLLLAGSAALVQLAGDLAELGGGISLEGFEHLLEVVGFSGELTLDGGELRLDLGDCVLVDGRGGFRSGDLLLELLQLSVTLLLGQSLLQLVLGGVSHLALEGHLLVNHLFLNGILLVSHFSRQGNSNNHKSNSEFVYLHHKI